MEQIDDELATLQTLPYRRDVLIQHLVEKCHHEPLSILEIGTWGGLTAVAMAETLMEYNEGKGTILCVDSWLPLYKTESDDEKSNLVRMNRAARENLIIPVFLENIKPFGDMISYKRGLSRDILPTLDMESFDFIYVDGSHLYDDVLSDINLSLKLLKEDGVLCGDDLELQAHGLDSAGLALTEELKNRELLMTGLIPVHYHPGVTMAIRDLFGRVSVDNGIWSIQMKKLLRQENKNGDGNISNGSVQESSKGPTNSLSDAD